jgi:hypothetical protein
VSEPIVTLEHCRRLEYCSRGLRAFFARHGLDLRDFAENGLPASVIEATGDSMAIAAAGLARTEAAQQEQQG